MGCDFTSLHHTQNSGDRSQNPELPLNALHSMSVSFVMSPALESLESPPNAHQLHHRLDEVALGARGHDRRQHGDGLG